MIHKILIIITFLISLSFGQRVVGYYPYWMQSEFPPDEIDLNVVTHVIHSFGWPDKEGNILSYSGMFNSGISDVIHAKDRTFLLSLGGWGNDEGFPVVAASADLRKTFINNLIQVCEDNGYDGVDLDWEFPQSTTDRSNLNLLVSEMDSIFNAYDPNWLITMAVPTSNWSGQWHDFNTLKKHIDFFNAMTYNMHGTWTGHNGHNSPLYQSPPNDPDGSCHTGINYLIIYRGIPKSQVNMGVPFWGLQFNASEINGSFTGDIKDVRYSDIPSLIGNGWARKWDKDALAPYLVSDDNTRILTYDDPESIRLKSEYAIERELGGMMIWALGYDRTSNGQELIKSIRKNYLSIEPAFINSVPDKFSIKSYPNPFNSSLKIQIDVPKDALVFVNIFDITGREVDGIVDQYLNRGRYTFTWQAKEHRSGLYFVRSMSNNSMISQKVLLIK